MRIERSGRSAGHQEAGGHVSYQDRQVFWYKLSAMAAYVSRYAAPDSRISVHLSHKREHEQNWIIFNRGRGYSVYYRITAEAREKRYI